MSRSEFWVSFKCFSSAFARLCSSTRALFVVGKGGVMWFFLLAKWVGVMWWLLIWRHLSSPENSRLPISTNPCTTTFPAHTPSYSRAKNAKKWKWKVKVKVHHHIPHTHTPVAHCSKNAKRISSAFVSRPISTRRTPLPNEYWRIQERH